MSTVGNAFNGAGGYSSDEIRALLDDIRLVGDRKLLGYLPVYTITDICREDPRVLREQAEAKGLKALLLTEDDCGIGSGALYVYDAPKLQAFLLLPQNKAILERNGWPVDAEDFVQNLKASAKDKPLYDLVALAFNDERPEYQQYVRRTAAAPVPWKPF